MQKAKGWTKDWGHPLVDEYLAKSLALVTLLYVLLCFLLHVRLSISLSEGFVRQGSASCVASTNLFM